MSAAEMREAAARLAMSKLEAMGLRGTGHIVGEAILGLPLPDAAEKPQEAADWSDLPRDMYVVRAWKPDGMFWCAEVAQVPHALAPEVRYVRALPLPDEEGMVEALIHAKRMCEVELRLQIDGYTDYFNPAIYEAYQRICRAINGGKP